ncbi:hypothetical protein L218DRAFT_577223 [Marasmius fiardii PR-910]|nr:hypothetical protein L218DRAFT_577223 [Marasmius fiardii PR-910]
MIKTTCHSLMGLRLAYQDDGGFHSQAYCNHSSTPVILSSWLSSRSSWSLRDLCSKGLAFQQTKYRQQRFRIPSGVSPPIQHASLRRRLTDRNNDTTAASTGNGKTCSVSQVLTILNLLTSAVVILLANALRLVMATWWRGRTTGPY